MSLPKTLKDCHRQIRRLIADVQNQRRRLVLEIDANKGLLADLQDRTQELEASNAQIPDLQKQLDEAI